MGAFEDALGQALQDAERAELEVKQRAHIAVSGLQHRVQQDGGVKVLSASQALGPLVKQWAEKRELTPGEAALCLISYSISLLALVPGIEAHEARAIAIEMASGPRTE